MKILDVFSYGVTSFFCKCEPSLVVTMFEVLAKYLKKFDDNVTWSCNL